MDANRHDDIHPWVLSTVFHNNGIGSESGCRETIDNWEGGTVILTQTEQLCIGLDEPLTGVLANVASHLQIYNCIMIVHLSI